MLRPTVQVSSFCFAIQACKFLLQEKNLAARKILLFHNINFFGGGVSVTIFVEEPIFKKCKTRKWQRKT